MLDDKVKRTLKCMILGSLFYNVVLIILFSVASIIFFKSKSLSNRDILSFLLKNIVCILIGFICSIVGLYSMATSLSKAVSANDEKYAKRYMVLTSVVRLLIFCIILIIVINEKKFGVTGGMMFALATLSIKISAYLAPVIEKRVMGS